MKTLFISLNKDYILDTAGENIILKYDLLNDILYELGAELAFKTKDDSIGDKTKILTDIRDARPETQEEIVEKINASIISKLLLPEIPDEASIVFPDSYADWMLYNSNQSYAAIGKKLKESGNKVTLSLTDIYTDYIEEKLLPKIKNIINADKDIVQFTIVGVNDPQAVIVKAIRQFKESLRFEPYDGGRLQLVIGYAIGNGIGAQKNFEKAFVHYLAAAETRHAIAAHWVGYSYHMGLGTAEDLSKALLWYNIGAELGNHDSEACAALFYDKGVATPIDYAKAAHLYERSTSGNSNISFALNNLADIYYNGRLGEPNYKKAFEYYFRETETAAESVNSLYMAGYMLYNGQGVEKNDKEALKLLSKASDKGHKDAHFLAGKLYAAGVGSDFGTPENEKAKTYYQRGIDNGDINSSLEYAKILISESNAANGQDIVENLRKASDKGLKEASYLLAIYLHDNKGLKHDLGEEYSPINLLSKLASENYEDSASLLKSYQQEIDEEIARIEKKNRERREREAERLRKIKEQEEKQAAEQREKERLKEIRRVKCFKQYEIYSKARILVNALVRGIDKVTDKTDNDSIKALIEPARKGLPIAKAALGFLLLKYNPNDKNALQLVLTSNEMNDDMSDFYEDVMNYVNEYLPDNHSLQEEIQAVRSSLGVEDVCFGFIALIYFFGLGVEKDLYKAIDFANKSDSSLGYCIMGIANREGLGTPKDLKQAIKIFKRGIDKSPSCELYYEYAVALSKLDDYDMQYYYHEMKDCFRFAAQWKHPFGCLEMAKDSIEDENYAEAQQWLHKAIKFSEGNEQLILKCQSLLREIGGRVIDYTSEQPISVYFDEIGPTLEKPKVEGERDNTQTFDSNSSLDNKSKSDENSNDLLKSTQERLRQKMEEVKKSASEKVKSKSGFFSKLFGKKK